MSKTNWRHGVRVKAPGKTRMFGKNFNILLPVTFPYYTTRGGIRGSTQSQPTTLEELEEDAAGESKELPVSHNGKFDCSGFVSSALKAELEDWQLAVLERIDI